MDDKMYHEPQIESELQAPGRIVGDRYQITSVLGQGGAGITYAAIDLHHNHPVALKALSLQRMQDWTQLDRFEREAQMLAKLNHPRIPRYLDHFHVDAPNDRTFYIVQALAPGKDLFQRVQSGWRTDEAGIRNILQQVLEILTYLHQQKPPVVHRDLKPQNLVMDDDGQVALVDFGAVQETYYNTFMRGSTMVGTFGYMAPEQFRGQADPQADLYALGATGLFLLTHRSPAELPQERLRVSFRNQVKISDSLADWLERCLEPDLDDRMHSAKEAAARLRGRIVMPNWKGGLPWKMAARLGIASVVLGLGLNTFKYDLLTLTGWDGLNNTERLICRAVRTEDMGEVRSYLRFNAQDKVRDLLSCPSFSNKTAQAILDSGVQVDSSSPARLTLLYWAIRSESTDNLQLLFDRGLEINENDKKSESLLNIAIQNRSSIEIIKLLLDKGAKVNPRSGSDTPLHTVVDTYRFSNKNSDISANNQFVIEIAKLLLSRGANINARDGVGQTPLGQTIQEARFTDDRASSLTIIQFLIEAGADVNLADDYGRSPLYEAVTNQLPIEVVQMLLKKGANVNAQDQFGKTVLHGAVEHCASSQIVSELLERGANVKMKDSVGNTLLHTYIYACAHQNNIEMTKLLLSQGLDINTKNMDGNTPLHVAIAGTGPLSVIQVLIAAGADVNLAGQHGRSPLHQSIVNDSSVDVVQVLLEKGANSRMQDKNGNTLFHYAVDFLVTTQMLMRTNELEGRSIKRFSEILKIMSIKGADINAKNNSNDTPLHVAINLGMPVSGIKILLERGADVNAKDVYGRTALKIASNKQGFDEVVKTLREKGAKY
jgi:serine/threonine protein kinase